jgi:putative hemolysin
MQTLASNPSFAALSQAPSHHAARSTPRARLEASWARTDAEVREAQRLRHRVFAIEMGAKLQVPAGTPPGHDADRFDEHSDHLLVRAIEPGRSTGHVVGTYRVLTPRGANRAGGFYSETEFDLTALDPLRSRMAELGRSCIDPAWRTGGTLMLLWSALGEFMMREGLDMSFGCASIGIDDGGHVAASVWRRLRATHLASPERRVRPLCALPLAALRDDLPAEPPALIKGYLRCGAELLGPPAWDADFNTADLPMLMTLEGLPSRHRRHFLESPAGAR